MPPEAEALFGRLKDLRISLAKERGVPAYAIFPDKALIDEYLARLTHAIEEADGPTASEAVYMLSCLIRKNVRELSISESAPEDHKNVSGAQS